MAPKRPTVLDQNQPPASPSQEEDSNLLDDSDAENGEEELSEQQEEEETDSESEEEQKQKLKKHHVNKSARPEEEGQASINPTQPTGKKSPFPQKPTSTPAVPNEYSSGDETAEESDSDADSEKTQQSPSASNFIVQPIVSKSTDEPSKTSKKQIPKPLAPSATPTKRGAKRQLEAEQNGKDSRKKKSKVEEEDVVVEEKKSSGITRLWSNSDEIAILQGMIDYRSRDGADPYADMGAFHEFVKKSLHVSVSKGQLTDKIRRLKKKYQNNAKKGENGEDPVFSNPHDVKSFELSKNIWDGGATKALDGNVKSNTSKPRKNDKAINFVAAQKEDGKDTMMKESVNGEVKSDKTVKEAVDGEVNSDKMMKEVVAGEVKSDKENFGSMYPNLIDSLPTEQCSFLSMSGGASHFLMENISLIGHTKAKQLEEKWKSLVVKEVEVYQQRLELIREQTKLVLDALKTSGP